jgi:hypothetical protein
LKGNGNNENLFLAATRRDMAKLVIFQDRINYMGTLI